jgi:hypothetical protein
MLWSGVFLDYFYYEIMGENNTAAELDFQKTIIVYGHGLIT